VPRSGLTQTLQAVVAAILPQYPALDPAVRAAVEQEVTRYVARQIGAMPSFLRFPYRVALLTFDWLPLLRYGRPFHNLPPARSAGYLAWWNDAPILAMRDFVRLIRSSALLVYFDHPSVVQELEAQPALAQRREARG
jgi:hypothetical protein